MANKSHSPVNTIYMCKYNIVFTPRYWRKIINNKYKAKIIDILK